jgi:hypothetical protein
VRKTALKDALLPREIVTLTTLPQSGFVQQPLSLLTVEGNVRHPAQVPGHVLSVAAKIGDKCAVM